MFVGCLIHMEDLHNNRFPGIESWMAPTFSWLRNRFLKLSNHLRFDYLDTRNDRRARNNCVPVREIWGPFTLNLGRESISGLMLTVDQSLVPWRAHCSFLHRLCQNQKLYSIKLIWTNREVNLGKNSHFSHCTILWKW